MKKRITKKELFEQIAQLEQQNKNYAIRMEQANLSLHLADQKLKRFERIAGIRVDHLPERNFHEIVMRVDRHEWNDGGSRLLKELVLNMFARMHRDFAADAFPDLDKIERNADIQRFLAGWLYVTVNYSLRGNMFGSPSAKFWHEVVTRFLGVIVALKEAGMDNYEVRESLIHYARQHPIPT